MYAFEHIPSSMAFFRTELPSKVERSPSSEKHYAQALITTSGAPFKKTSAYEESLASVLTVTINLTF